MKRPSDQAKLLFLGLLKTVSALATEPRGAVTAASSSWHMNAAWRRGVMTTTSTMLSSTTTTTTVATPSLTATSWKTPQDRTVSSSSSSSSSSSNGNNNNNNNMPTAFPPLTLRLAKRTDVPSMQRCNLATLPENYNGAFYVQHMRDWPELALVVVVEEEEEEEPETLKSRRSSSPRDFIGSNSGLSFSPFPTNLQQQNPPPLVVAYVLGKVEERTVERNVVEDAVDDIDNGWLHRRLSSASQQQQTIYETQHIGHITSLAVLQDYRRKGLAQALMEQLHVQLQRHYGTASQVGLHVRQSNKAATALYHGFGYAVTECIPQYYQDGEDAYYMMKDLEQQRHAHANGAMSSAATRGGGGGGLFGQYWRQRQRAQATSGAAEEEKHDDPWAMPRSVGRQPREEESEEQLMTGTF